MIVMHTISIHLVITMLTCMYQLANRPNTGRSFYEETKTDLLSKYMPISPERAGTYNMLYMYMYVCYMHILSYTR